jgi:predicted Rossmann fold nucleotide-binding protein DprA/Smf involved in DNA uptake
MTMRWSDGSLTATVATTRIVSCLSFIVVLIEKNMGSGDMLTAAVTTARVVACLSFVIVLVEK